MQAAIRLNTAPIERRQRQGAKMQDFDEGFMRQEFDHDRAVVAALVRTEKSIFDTEEQLDEDLKALYEK